MARRSKDNDATTAVAKKPPITRMYVAIKRDTSEPAALIEAPNVQRALSHMARKTFAVRYAEQRDIVACVRAGVAPEQISVAEEVQNEQEDES